MPYDVIIVGGGPSGLMASIAAATSQANVLLVDKGDKLGRKLGISGGGRCNVTNASPVDELIRNIPGNGRFLHSALAAFGSSEIITFFESLGIALKEEDNGRMFPVSDKAKTVVNALIGEARKRGVEMRVNAPVKSITYEQNRVKGITLQSGEQIEASAVIVACGGKSVPYTGSTGDGYPWAERAGHTITELYPTEVPLISHERWIASRELQGLSLRNVSLAVWNEKGKKVISHQGDMIITHFGLSGPIALRCSQFIIKTMKKEQSSQVKLTIDLFPDTKEGEWNEQWQQAWKDHSKKTVKNVLKPLLPDRLVAFLMERAEVSPDDIVAQTAKTKLDDLTSMMKGLPVYVHGTKSIKDAFVTGGGVHLKEMDPKTMASKKMPGLYFCGEILDIHGYTGGYNITAAFSTGHAAGSSAAIFARSE